MLCMGSLADLSIVYININENLIEKSAGAFGWYVTCRFV